MARVSDSALNRMSAAKVGDLARRTWGPEAYATVGHSRNGGSKRILRRTGALSFETLGTGDTWAQAWRAAAANGGKS